MLLAHSVSWKMKMWVENENETLQTYTFKDQHSHSPAELAWLPRPGGAMPDAGCKTLAS